MKNIFNNYIDSPAFEASYHEYFRMVAEACKKVESDPLPSLFHPIIVSEETLQSLKQQSEQMAAILEKMIGLYLKHKKIQSFFNFPKELHEWICIDPGYNIKIPISRYDGFWDGTHFEFCEFNTDGTSGMDEINTLDEAFLATDLGKEIAHKHNSKNFNLRKSTLDILLKCYKDFGGKKDKPNIAIVDFSELATMAEFRSLKNYFSNKGYPTEICDIRNLKLRNNELYHNSFKIDLVYRRAVTDDMFPRRNEIKEFLKGYKEHAACVVGPLRSHIAHTKLLLTFLTSTTAEKYFSEEEIKFINNHIPWTRPLSNDSALINKIISNKDNYFLKPHNANSGKGVYAGEELDTESFKKVIRQILDNKKPRYLVQEKIQIPTDYFVTNDKKTLRKYKINIASYVFENKLLGFFTRVSTNSVINTDRGALALPIFLTLN